MLEPLNLTWFEEPVICHNHEGEAAIAKALDTPIASGETVHTHRGILRMLQARAADILYAGRSADGRAHRIPSKPVRCARPSTRQSRRISSPEVSLPLLAALPNALYLEYMPWFEPLYGQGSCSMGGPSGCPNRAGLGRKL